MASVVPEGVRFSLEDNDKERICRMLGVKEVPDEIEDWARRMKFFNDKDGVSKVNGSDAPTVQNMLPYVCSMWDMGIIKPLPKRKATANGTASNAN